MSANKNVVIYKVHKTAKWAKVWIGLPNGKLLATGKVTPNKDLGEQEKRAQIEAYLKSRGVEEVSWSLA